MYLAIGGVAAFFMKSDRLASTEDRVQAYIKQIETGDNQASIQAARELSQLGPKAAPAIPALIKMMNSGTTIFDATVVEAATALENIREPALPALQEMVDRKEGKTMCAQSAIDAIKKDSPVK